MSQGIYGVRKRSAAPGDFQTADLPMTEARSRAASLSALDKRTAYVVVNVHTDQVFATFMNGRDVS